MSRDRNDAVLRLLSSWFDRVAEDEDFPLRISVSKENFRAVVRYDLFRDHFRIARLTRMQLDASRRGARARERAMIKRGWQVSRADGGGNEPRLRSVCAQHDYRCGPRQHERNGNRSVALALDGRTITGRARRSAATRQRAGQAGDVEDYRAAGLEVGAVFVAGESRLVCLCEQQPTGLRDALAVGHQTIGDLLAIGNEFRTHCQRVVHTGLAALLVAGRFGGEGRENETKQRQPKRRPKM
jgi:hypothetical protein